MSPPDFEKKREHRAGLQSAEPTRRDASGPRSSSLLDDVRRIAGNQGLTALLAQRRAVATGAWIDRPRTGEAGVTVSRLGEGGSAKEAGRDAVPWMLGRRNGVTGARTGREPGAQAPPPGPVVPSSPVAVGPVAGPAAASPPPSAASPTVQRELEPGKLNIVGEIHEESDPRRDREEAMLQGFGPYWMEFEFKHTTDSGTRHGDPLDLSALQRMAFLAHTLAILGEQVRIALLKLKGARASEVPTNDLPEIRTMMTSIIELQIVELVNDLNNWRATKPKPKDANFIHEGFALCVNMGKAFAAYVGIFQREETKRGKPAASLNTFNRGIVAWKKWVAELLLSQDYDVGDPSGAKQDPYSGSQGVVQQLTGERSLAMYMTAEEAVEKKSLKGVWKVGETHVQDMTKKLQGRPSARIAITTRAEFNEAYQAWLQGSLANIPGKVPTAGDSFSGSNSTESGAK